MTGGSQERRLSRRCLQKCKHNEEQLKTVKETVESMKNTSETISESNMVNTSENISWTNMKDEILDAALKVLKSENAIMNKELEDEVKTAIENLNWEFELLDEKVMISMINTSLMAPGHSLTACNAAPPAMPHRLQHLTARLIQNGRQGLERV